MNKQRIVVLGCALALSGLAQADDCEHEKELNLKLGTASEMRLDVGAGSLYVRGGDGDSITATGRGGTATTGLRRFSSTGCLHRCSTT